jgi:hypothetical protein
VSELTEQIDELRADAARLDWPEAADIRRRGDTRTRRRIGAGAVALVLVAALAGAYALGRGTTPAPQPAAPGGDITLDSLSVAPSRMYYAVGHDASGYSLMRTTDYSGEQWERVGDVTGVDGEPHLLVGTDSYMWIMTPTRLLSSADGGQHWNAFPLGPGGGGPTAVMMNLLLFIHDGQLYESLADQPTAPVSLGPTTYSDVVALESGEVFVQRRSDGGWQRSDTTAARWLPVANPCAGLLPAGTDAVMSSAPDGTLWTVCLAPGGVAPGWQIAISTNKGETWTPHPGGGAGGDDLWPTSATIAWRTGHGDAVYRTTDAADHWTAVAAIAADDPITCGIVIDDDTAVYVTEGGGTTLHITHDGGQHWTSLPFPL